ncbi:MAG: NADH-quinone oxidoreductase [uncultured bacterium]|nr:MAG: NADH-quinone oxidoreductase [uncultured bacterium]
MIEILAFAGMTRETKHDRDPHFRGDDDRVGGDDERVDEGNMTDIEIEIDGQKLTAKPNQTVIQVADAAGIYIPRFCYHKHLSVAANCRMCLVDVEKSPKALPACATPVMPGMKVFTKSQKTIEAQRAVMEFLLVNHPLDCPICDQGGECELQDLSMGYGSSHSNYNECKRSIADQDLGSLISTDMTRCIYCTRCVRFGEEIAGLREMGATFRGEHTEIGTYVQHAIQSEVSGNIIDLCPVGALTSKPYRFTARAWELSQHSCVAAHDCVGANINVHTRNGRVMRVVSRENAAINETWISDRDRFSYTGLYHPERLTEPMVKADGEWRAVEWQYALEVAARGLQDMIREFGADQFGALASPNSTLEEFYLLQKITRALGSQHVDYRLREIDTRDQSEMGIFPGFNQSLDEFEQSDAVLLIGSNLQKEQPNAALRLRKAIKNGAQVAVINPVDYRFNFAVHAKKITAPQQMAATLAAVANTFANEFSIVASDAETQKIVDLLRQKKKVTIIIGALAMHHTDASILRYLAQKIADHTCACVSIMTDGANAAGAWLAGAIPHRHADGAALNQPGLSAYQMLAKARKAYLLLNVEPDLDCANTHLATAAMQQAKFVVALSMYRSPILEAHADVILPIAAFTETSGTFVNGAGNWQSFAGTTIPFGSSRPAWKVLRVLGNFMHLDGFEYESSEEIKHEIAAIFAKNSATKMRFSTPKNVNFAEKNANFLARIGEIPLYSVDNLTRHAVPLQQAQTVIEGDISVIKMHPETAHKHNLAAGKNIKIQQQGAHTFSLQLDESIAKNTVWIAGGVPSSAELGDLMGEIQLC